MDFDAVIDDGEIYRYTAPIGVLRALCDDARRRAGISFEGSTKGACAGMAGWGSERGNLGNRPEIRAYVFEYKGIAYYLREVTFGNPKGNLGVSA
jgi:hypothetical protein